jgi:hypothetical protein
MLSRFITIAPDVQISKISIIIVYIIIEADVDILD